MAAIFPFCPMRPNPIFAGHLVFAKPQAESVSGDPAKPGGLQPLKNLLELPARLRPETASGQAEAFATINSTLKQLLERGHILQEEQPAIFVYEVSHGDFSQSGIWCLTNINDYQQGLIRPHERTLADSVRRLYNFRLHTGLEGSPVLLTFPPVPVLDEILGTIKQGSKFAGLGNAEGFHKLWRVADPALISRLTGIFRGIPVSYLADGHHRLESADMLATEFPDRNLVSTLYMPADQLRIEAFHRIVTPDPPLSREALFKELANHFYLHASPDNEPVFPVKPHRFGLLAGGNWFHLGAKTHTFDGRAEAAALDSAILQDFVLGLVFGIHDPGSDQRLRHAGGPKARIEFETFLADHPDALCFTLSPLSVADVFAAADGGYVLPPKSSWIIPKLPYGLLMAKHDMK